ncbi:MAG: DUF99 family protein [Ignisphaera sp.]
MSTCYLGIDDGYFDVAYKRIKLKHKTVLVGAVVCFDRFKDLYIELVTVDGLDALGSAFAILEKSLSLYNIDAVFLDGVTYAGFNIVDPRKLYALGDTPIITVFRHRLDLSKIYLALEKHFRDYRYRYEVIENIYSKSIELELKHIPTTIRIHVLGMDIVRAKRVVIEQCKVFADPYPLRIADRVASLAGRLINRSLDLF